MSHRQHTVTRPHNQLEVESIVENLIMAFMSTKRHNEQDRQNGNEHHYSNTPRWEEDNKPWKHYKGKANEKDSRIPRNNVTTDTEKRGIKRTLPDIIPDCEVRCRDLGEEGHKCGDDECERPAWILL